MRRSLISDKLMLIVWGGDNGPGTWDRRESQLVGRYQVPRTQHVQGKARLIRDQLVHHLRAFIERLDAITPHPAA